jgi:hypothetical protein
VIPVDQTTFGRPHGNCFSACIASIMHVPLADVPTFCAREDEGWWTDFLEWLAPRGMYALALTYGHDRMIDGFHVLSGKSPRGDFMHSVVGWRDKIVHDPHPSRDGLLSRDDCIILVPMDIGEFKRRTEKNNVT